MKQEKIKLKEWDISEHLKTEEDIAGFLRASFEEAGDDEEYIAHVLEVVSRASGMVKVAKNAGVSSSKNAKEISKQLGADFANLLKIVGALGLKLMLA